MTTTLPLPPEPVGGAIVETRFGPLPGDPRQVVLMLDPLPGFESCRRYVLVSSAELDPFTCLQGLDEPRPSFLVIDPRVVEPAFQAVLPADGRRRLEASDDDALLWLSLVRVEEGRQASVNLRAPVVVNARRMIGMQLISPDTTYSIEHPLGSD
jgi:flagellar assembly factor FliW